MPGNLRFRWELRSKPAWSAHRSLVSQHFGNESFGLACMYVINRCFKLGLIDITKHWIWFLEEPRNFIPVFIHAYRMSCATCNIVSVVKGTDNLTITRAPSDSTLIAEVAIASMWSCIVPLKRCSITAPHFCFSVCLMLTDDTQCSHFFMCVYFFPLCVCVSAGVRGTLVLFICIVSHILSTWWWLAYWWAARNPFVVGCVRIVCSWIACLFWAGICDRVLLLCQCTWVSCTFFTYTHAKEGVSLESDSWQIKEEKIWPRVFISGLYIKLCCRVKGHIS